VAAVSFERTHHPRLAPMEAEIAIGSLCNMPPAEIARSVVIATNIDGQVHFASSLKNLELAHFLADVLSDLIAAMPGMADRRGGCEGGQHYFVKQGGQWVCTMCGATR
jgi:hypothetical protein